jgi:hypothetical protein
VALPSVTCVSLLRTYASPLASPHLFYVRWHRHAPLFVTCSPQDGGTALHFAAMHSHLGLIDKLLAKGADIYRVNSQVLYRSKVALPLLPSLSLPASLRRTQTGPAVPTHRPHHHARLTPCHMHTVPTA